MKTGILPWLCLGRTSPRAPQRPAEHRSSVGRLERECKGICNGPMSHVTVNTDSCFSIKAGCCCCHAGSSLSVSCISMSMLRPPCHLSTQRLPVFFSKDFSSPVLILDSMLILSLPLWAWSSRCEHPSAVFWLYVCERPLVQYSNYPHFYLRETGNPVCSSELDKETDNA